MENDFIKDIKEIMRYSIVPIIFILLIILLFIVDSKADKKAWNNGFCECGGRWEYVDILHNVNYVKDYGYHDNKKYIYKCNKCGKMHEFNELR